ncbi:MAG: hypothetical protein AB1643_02575 [Patescibacteria group bacterium]
MIEDLMLLAVAWLIIFSFKLTIILGIANQRITEIILGIIGISLMGWRTAILTINRYRLLKKILFLISKKKLELEIKLTAGALRSFYKISQNKPKEVNKQCKKDWEEAAL